MVLSAQMGKAGPPMHGKDLHVGDLAWGILPAAAPLAIGSLTIAGMALAFARDGSGRVALSFIGEGGSSLGEWHEAINLCAARRLPAVFAVENNQTALSTPVRDQSAVRVFADKASGYGIPGITIDGTDPDEIAAAFAWAVERARAGRGPALIELVSMRMCGHAHHDDMLYLGKEPQPGWEYPPLHATGYADPDLYAFWSARDPIPAYAARLQLEELIDGEELDRLKSECEAIVEFEAQEVIAAAWPPARQAGEGVFSPARRHDSGSKSSIPRCGCTSTPIRLCQPLDAGAPFDRTGSTLLEAVMLGVGDALRADPSVFVFGEDVGGSYGNAFLLLRPLLEEFGDRILNSPLAEGAVLGACVGAALAGQRPIGEMQFNDFVATGFNQLVNNAAKIRYRWGGSVPMVVRMPWGGLRHAGPYHSQNTEAWFYRTPGLKIVVPSTPADARALMASAVADPDPVLYYEHIALYRDPRIKQVLAAEAPAAHSDRPRRASARRRRSRHHFLRRLRPCRAACRRAARRRRHSGERARPALAGAARSRGGARLRAPLQPGPHRARGLAHRRHRREPGGDHSGGSVRVARRARPHPRRPRHAGPVLPAARGRVPALRRRDRTRGTAADGLLTALPWSHLIAKKIAIVLQTPKDQQSSVLLTYQDLAAELARRGHVVTIVTPEDFPASRRAAGRFTPLVYPFVDSRLDASARASTATSSCFTAIRDGCAVSTAADTLAGRADGHRLPRARAALPRGAARGVGSTRAG